MIRYFYAFVGLLFLYASAPAQAQKQALCGFDRVHNSRLAEDAGYRQQIESMDRAWSAYVKDKAAAQQRIVVEGGDSIAEIPVVIHVVHTGGAMGSNYNRTDADLLQWIDYLNQVFAGTYPPYAGSGSAPVPIRFVLAQRDPDCNPTSGIVRVDGTTLAGYSTNGLATSGGTGVDRTDLTALSQWPPNDYFNIYVVNKINGEDGFTTTGSYVAGFATVGANLIAYAYDGAFMLSYTAEAGNITLPHELGHAFGLYHTFQLASPGCDMETDCTSEGDRVCDTDPVEELSAVPCPGAGDINPCTSLPYGTNGVQHNLMNYTNCVANHFTQGQADRMRFMLESYRAELLHSMGGLPPAIPPLAVPIPATCIPGGISNPTDANIGPCTVMLDSIRSFSRGFNDWMGSNYYMDYTGNCNGAYRTSLILGESYTLSVSIENSDQSIKAYIDYNNDGDFNDVGELVMEEGSSTPGTYTATITPPAGAVQFTPLRMRVIADFGSTVISPCGNLNYGQVEDFAVTIIPDAPLPLALLEFKGSVEGDAALLNWRVSPDASLSGFELERSRDGRNFKSIADIPYSGKQTYVYTDPMEAPGAYYYRLKVHSAEQTDFSRVVALAASAPVNAALYIYPNPTDDVLHIQSSSVLKAIRLMTSTGQLLKSVHPGTPQYTLSLEGLAAGVYLVRIIESDGSVSQKKVLKK